jgi:hypothetical protein
VGAVSVPIPCPRCGADHLHAAVYVEAEAGHRFEVIGDGPEDETVLVRFNPDGQIEPPEEAHLLCCACDRDTDRFIRWAGDAPT